MNDKYFLVGEYFTYPPLLHLFFNQANANAPSPNCMYVGRFEIKIWRANDFVNRDHIQQRRLKVHLMRDSGL